MLTVLSDDLEMSHEEFAMIRDFIHEKSGIYFAENKKYLVRNRLLKRMAELSIKSFRDYLYHVKYDSSMREFQRLMDVITTNETSFYRNEPQLLAFSDEVLPQIMANRESQNRPGMLKIWSAGCSTGEEPYTLAMLILEKLKNKPGWTAEIIANDISESVLHTARRGHYKGLTLRNVPRHMLDTCFCRSGETYTVKPEVKALVKFGLLNLNDQRMVSLNSGFDVIFCRNVMIYFSEEAKKRIVRGFFNALRPGGYFFIGHSETMHGVSKAFKPVYFRNALVYGKEAPGTPDSPAAAADRSGTMSANDLLTRIKKQRVTAADKATIRG